MIADPLSTLRLTLLLFPGSKSFQMPAYWATALQVAVPRQNAAALEQFR